MIDACQLLPHDDGCTNQCCPNFCHRMHTLACHGTVASSETTTVTSATAAAQATSAGLSAAHSLASSLGSGSPVPMDEITGFESGIHLDKESHVIILIGCNAVHAISLSSLPEMFTWASTLSKVVTDDHFRVTLSQTADGSKLPQGLQASIHVQHWRICLIGEPPAGCKFLCAWPLNMISRAYMLTTSAPSGGGAVQSVCSSTGVGLVTTCCDSGGSSSLRNRNSRNSILSAGRMSTVVPGPQSTLAGLGSNTGSCGPVGQRNVFHLEANGDAGKGRGSHTFEMAFNVHLPDLTSAIDRLMALRRPQSSVSANKSSLVCGNNGCSSLFSTISGHYHHQQNHHHCHDTGTARSLQPSYHYNQPWAMMENAGSLKNVTSCHGIGSKSCSIGACVGGIGSSCSPISSSFSPSEDANSCFAGSIGAMQQGSQLGSYSCHLLPTPQCQNARSAGADVVREVVGSTGNIGFLSDGDGNLTTAVAAVTDPPPVSGKSLITSGKLQRLLPVDEAHLRLPTFLPQRRPVLPFDYQLLNDSSTTQRQFKVNVSTTAINGAAATTDSCHRASTLSEVVQQQIQHRLPANTLTTNNSGSSTAASPTSPVFSSYPLDDCRLNSVDPAATTVVGLTTFSYDRKVVGSLPPRRGISEYANFSTMLSASKTSDYSSNDQQQRGWTIGGDSHHPLDGLLVVGEGPWSRSVVDRLQPASAFYRNPSGDSPVERKSSPQLVSVDEGIGMDYPAPSCVDASDGHRLAPTPPNTTAADVLLCHSHELGSLQVASACHLASRTATRISLHNRRLQSKSCDDLRSKQLTSDENGLTTTPLLPSHQSLSNVPGNYTRLNWHRVEEKHGEPQLLVDLQRRSGQKTVSHRSTLDDHHPDMVFNRVLSSANTGVLSSSDSCLPCCESAVSGTDKTSVEQGLSLLTVLLPHGSHWFPHRSKEVTVSEKAVGVEQRLIRPYDHGWYRWLRNLLTRLTSDRKSVGVDPDERPVLQRATIAVLHSDLAGDVSEHPGDSLRRLSNTTTRISNSSNTMVSPTSIARTSCSTDVGQLLWRHDPLSRRSEAIPTSLSGGRSQAGQTASLPPAYCNMTSLLQQRHAYSRNREPLPSAWSAPGDSNQSHLPQSPDHRHKSAPILKNPAAYVNVASSCRAAQLTKPRSRQNWFHTFRQQQPGTCPQQQQQVQEISCCDLHNGGTESDARCLLAITSPLTCATGNGTMQPADSSMVRSHQLLHAPHLLSVGDLPEEVRDPSRNYAVVDLRPSPASSMNTAFLRYRSHYPHHHRTTTLEDIKWYDSSAAGIFGTKTNSSLDGLTLTPGDNVSTDTFPLGTPVPGVVRPSSLRVRQGFGGARRRHSHSLSLTMDSGGFSCLDPPRAHTRSRAGGTTMTLDRSMHHQPVLPSQQQQLNYVHVFATTCSNRAQSTTAEPFTRLPAGSQEVNTTKTCPTTTINISQTSTTGGANSYGSTGSSGNGSRSMTSSATSSSGEGGASGLVMGTARVGGSVTADTGFISSCSPPAPSGAGPLNHLTANDGHVAYTQIDFARTLALGELSGDMENQQQQSLQHSIPTGGVGGKALGTGATSGPLLPRWSVSRISSASCSANANSSGGGRGSSTTNVNSVKKTLSRSIRSIRRGTAAGHRKKSGGLD